MQEAHLHPVSDKSYMIPVDSIVFKKKIYCTLKIVFSKCVIPDDRARI